MTVIDRHTLNEGVMSTDDPVERPLVPQYVKLQMTNLKRLKSVISEMSEGENIVALLTDMMNNPQKYNRHVDLSETKAMQALKKDRMLYDSKFVMEAVRAYLNSTKPISELIAREIGVRLFCVTDDVKHGEVRERINGIVENLLNSLNTCGRTTKEHIMASINVRNELSSYAKEIKLEMANRYGNFYHDVIMSIANSIDIALKRIGYQDGMYPELSAPLNEEQKKTCARSIKLTKAQAKYISKSTSAD